METNELKVIIPETSVNLVASEITLPLEYGNHTVCVSFFSGNSIGKFLFPYRVASLILFIPWEEDLEELTILSGSASNIINALRELNYLILEKAAKVNLLPMRKSLYNGVFCSGICKCKPVKNQFSRQSFLDNPPHTIRISHLTEDMEEHHRRKVELLKGTAETIQEIKVYPF
ncbi:hypothetical protein AGMMS49975_14300 [Clostridia bacterium]|nr:hypothetical protein AGMMS49975_14300 [Clostridia bacterium]